MLVCLILIISMTGLLVWAVRTRLPRGCRPAKWQQAFYRLACRMLLLARTRKEIALTPFAVERLAHVLTVVYAGLLASVLVQAAVAGTTYLVDGYGLNRPEDGENVRQLQVRIGEEQTEQIEVVVNSRRYTEQEERDFLDQAVRELEDVMLGDNASADEVRGRVCLPDTLLDGRVAVSWTQEPAGLLDSEGRVTEDIPESGELLQLEAILSCGGSSCVYECALNLLPPLYTDEEELRRALEKEVERADEDSAEQSILRLPKEMGGERLTWQEEKPSALPAGLLFTAAAGICAWIGKNQELQKKGEERARQMTLDYPDLLFKLSMLLNAGLTMQGAFFKIALEYKNRRGQGVRFAYEEMLTACREMQSGVPEARAYENFGRRCGGNGYIKLGTMLSSNLQKGSEGLAQLLQEEAQLSMEERRQMAKKLGEEAGTKLLLPMVLMLLVVLVILLVPAMLAF